MSNKTNDGESGYCNPPKRTRFGPKNTVGRYGRGGKPKACSPEHSQMLLNELNHVVQLSDGSAVPRILRLIQQIELAAFGGDIKASALLLKLYADAEAELRSFYNEHVAPILQIKYQLSEEFSLAERKGLAPPDITPHPRHVQNEGLDIYLTGPKDELGRICWEYLKYKLRCLRIALSAINKYLKSRPDDEGFLTLKREQRASWARHIRLVPQGWDWNERIYTIGSTTEKIIASLLMLRRMGLLHE